jgi:hypothetical protein
MKPDKNVSSSKSPSGGLVPADDTSHPHLPPPTFWPAGLALGVTLIFWSLITSWVVLMMGGWLFIVSLVGWIRDIRHERKIHS